MLRFAFLAAVLASPVSADIVVAAHTIRPNSVIAPGDLLLKPGKVAGAATDPGQLIGQEARVAIYAGRAVRLSDVGPPAVVARNQIVSIMFTHGGLSISTEGRALDRAGVGEVVRVINMSSRTTVSGRVTPDGQVQVSR